MTNRRDQDAAQQGIPQGRRADRPHQALHPAEAVKLAKETSPTKFDATVEVAMRLGVDPRKADQMVRGTVNLPHGTGKTARVIVFAAGDKAAEAEAAGADAVGSDDLVARIQDGLARLRRGDRHAGPDGQDRPDRADPRPARPDAQPEDRHRDDGRHQGRRRHQGREDHLPGRQARQPAPDHRQGVFRPEQLVDNYAAVLDEVLRAKPSAAKGKYVRKVPSATTMGPGIPVDPNLTRNLLETPTAAELTTVGHTGR